jgi:3-phosphoshikimate 1-carboxyvinyltransferase
MSLLARGKCRVENISTAVDVRTSLNAARSLGAQVKEGPQGLEIHGADAKAVDRAHIDCGNSGTTIRLLMGILSGLSGHYTLDGDISLRRRPMERVAAPLREMGADIRCDDGKCPVMIKPAQLRGITYQLPVPSAQLKSAILLAGLQAQGETNVMEPSPSRDHTERLIEAWGGSIEREEERITVGKSTLVKPHRLKVPGDPSSAAFFLSTAAIVPGSDIKVKGMSLNPGRIGFLRVLERMGAYLTYEMEGEAPEPWGSVGVVYNTKLKACKVDEREIPALVDEIPILALVATQAEGATEFRGVGELRVKESDRLEAIQKTLSAMGANVETRGDTLIVKGPTELKPIDHGESFGDHRIAMTLKMASLLTGREIEITDEQCIGISYPQFQDHLRGLIS